MPKFTITLFTLLLLIWPCQAYADVTGVYAAFDGKNAAIIHLVESSNGELRGQYEYIEIAAKNEVKISSRNLTGTVRKNAVAISFDAPLANWFLSTTMTGTISWGSLRLSYDGETSKYGKISLDDRDRIKQRIDAVAAKQKHEAVVTEVGKLYATLSTNVTLLTRGAADDEAWFRSKKAEYAALFSEIDALEEKWRKYRAARIDEHKIIAVENRHYEVEKTVWDLDAKVKSRSSGLRDLRIQIDKTGKKLYKLCDENRLNKSVAACASAEKTEAEYRTAIAGIRKAFDELANYRDTRKI